MRRMWIAIADKQCRKLKMGEVPWRGTLQLARDEIKLWSTVFSRKIGVTRSNRMIARLEYRVDIPRQLSFSREEIELKLRVSYRRHYSLKKKSGALRDSWILDLAALKAKECNRNEATIYKNIIQQECQKK